jgi:hypothetical protein
MISRWASVFLALCLPSAAFAQDLCGNGLAKSAGADIQVLASQRPGETSRITYVIVNASSTDKMFSLSVNYHPVDAVLGPPTGLTFDAYMLLPNPALATRERIVWSLDGVAWSDQDHWDTPRRRWGDPANTEGYISALAAQGSFNIDLLDSARRGGLFALKRLDANGITLSAGSVRYPSEAAIGALYAIARKKALADLKPCARPLPIPPVKERLL